MNGKITRRAFTTFVIITIFGPTLAGNHHGGDLELDVNKFNQLPRELRKGYLTSGAEPRNLGPTAKVEDLIEELQRDGAHCKDDHAKEGIAFALAAICQTPHRNDTISQQCLALADQLLKTRYSRSAVSIYYQVLGADAREFFKTTLKHSDSMTRIAAGIRLGLVAAMKDEEFDSVAEYFRQAIAAIKQRDDLKQIEGNPKNKSGKVHDSRREDLWKPRDSGDSNVPEITATFVLALLAMIFVVALQVNSRK